MFWEGELFVAINVFWQALCMISCAVSMASIDLVLIFTVILIGASLSNRRYPSAANVSSSCGCCSDTECQDDDVDNSINSLCRCSVVDVMVVDLVAVVI